MKYGLSMMDRMRIFALLPTQGGFATLTIIESVTKKVRPTEEEIKQYEIKSQGQSTFWNPEGMPASFDVELGQPEADLIRGELAKRNEAGSLMADDMGIYRMFMLEPSENVAEAQEKEQADPLDAEAVA